jgi:hypothetical protein
VPGCGELDEIDMFGTFTEEEARKLGILSLEDSSGSFKLNSDEKAEPDVETLPVKLDVQSPGTIHVNAHTQRRGY